MCYIICSDPDCTINTCDDITDQTYLSNHCQSKGLPLHTVTLFHSSNQILLMHKSDFVKSTDFWAGGNFQIKITLPTNFV